MPEQLHCIIFVLSYKVFDGIQSVWLGYKSLMEAVLCWRRSTAGRGAIVLVEDTHFRYNDSAMYFVKHSLLAIYVKINYVVFFFGS